MHSLDRTGFTKAATVGDSLQITPEEQQKWELHKQEIGNTLSNNELPASRSPAGHQMDHIELDPGAAPSIAPRYRRFAQLEGEIERQVDELLKKGKIQESASAFRHNRALATEKDRRWGKCVNFKPLNKITVKQKLPMHRVDDLLNPLEASEVFSIVDFADTSFQTLIHPEERHKTAFHTRTLKSEYTCISVRLVSTRAEV